MRIKHNQAAIAQNMRTLAMTSLFASCLFATSAMAQEAKTEPIATDRPDFVESGQVVGKGRF